MSDLSMFDTTLEHRTLEVIALQWDGSKERAMAITAALQRELPLRGAALTAAHHHREGNTRTGATNHLDLSIERTVDGVGWSFRLAPNEWLALWLYHDVVSHLDLLEKEHGESLFRPANPIITLHPRTKEITDV